MDILLINKNRHRITINTGLIGFMNRNISFKKQDNEIYQTNSIDLFQALYHLTYENENDIDEILNIQENETIEQVATFERKPNFKCKFNINKYSEQEKEFITMFDFQHSHLTQEDFEKIVKIILDYRQVYATTKFDVGKTKVKLNLPIKKDAIFKKQRISKVPIHLRERIQKLLDVLKKYDIIAPVNKEQLSTGNTFTNPVIILRKGESLKIVLDARYLNSMIDESKCNWPIEPVDVALTRINGTIFTTADLNSAYNQIPLDEESMRYTHFTIGNEQYCFKRLFYGISIGPAAFASILTHFLYPLIRKGTVITYVDDIFIQTNSYEQMFETLIEYHKVLLKENLKAAPDKTYFMLKKVKFLGHTIEDKKVKPLTSRIDGFQKLEPPTSMKALQRYLGTINFLAKYVYGMQSILQPLYNLLHKENDFKWTKEHQKIFEQMKKTITHNLELKIPDTTKPFYIITDASNTGIGAALLQQHPTEKKMRLISANSRLFTPIEMRLSTLIRECSAIIFALTEYEFLLTGSNHPIILFTDHKPIIYLFTLDEESMRYTHFTIGNEQYCFKRLFYGISIGPAAFAPILTHFLYPLIRKGTVITYVDDIFIQTNSYEQMFETLIEYHKILLKENLKAAPDKRYFMLKKVKFLGHIIEDKKVKPLTSRIDGFQKLEPPTSMKALQRYLGTINFLAKYVYGMQPILQPLYNLLHKENDFKWTKEHQTILEQMKRTITHKLELTMPDTKKPFYIITDASNTGIGAALLQQHPTEKKMRLISANSRLFTPIEMRLSTLIRECSAIIFALTEYEFLLTGSNHPIILFTDHKPIIYLFTQKNEPNHRVYRFQLILMKFPNLHIIWTEGKNLALPDLLSRTIDEEHFTKTRDITVEIPENIKFFFAKSPFANNLECKYSICNNTNNDNKDTTHYPVLANIHNNYFEINIDKNEYHPISYEKYNTETKTNFVPKYKPKTKNWQSPIVEKDDLIIEKNQKGPYIIHHDDDYLRLINNVKQEHNFEHAKIIDIFYDEKTKVTEELIKETQIIDPVLHKVKMWKKNNNKPHSITMDIRGNKGLFAYYRKFKSITIDEKTNIMKMIIRIKKQTIQRICLPLTLLLCVFYENHCVDTVGHTGLEKTKRNIMEKYYFPNLTTWIKILSADCIQCQTNKVFANTKTKSKQEQLAPTKTYFNEMIMIDTKGPIHPTSEGNNFIFVIVDAFSHYVTIMCAPQNNAHYAVTALFEHWFMKFGLPEEIRSNNGSEYINTELTHLCNYFEIKFKPSTTYAPWTNGLVEGTNRIIGQFIRTLLNEKYQNWSRKAKFFPYAYNTQYQTRLGMSPYEVVFNQKPRKPTKIKLGTTTDEMGNCNPTRTSACKTQPAHTHLDKQFSHPKIAKLQNGTFAKWFLDKEKHYNDTYQTITKILRNRKKLTDELNSRFRTAKPLDKNTFVLITNQQQIDGVSKKLIPLKTGPYLIIDKPTETTYILKDNTNKHITLHRNHIVPYFPKEKHIKLELQNYLLTKEIPTLKQPNTQTTSKRYTPPGEITQPNSYNLRKRKITIPQLCQ